MKKTITVYMSDDELNVIITFPEIRTDIYKHQVTLTYDLPEKAVPVTYSQLEAALDNEVGHRHYLDDLAKALGIEKP